MSPIVLGMLLGLGCATPACMVMIPLTFPTRNDKRSALLAAS